MSDCYAWIPAQRIKNKEAADLQTSLIEKSPIDRVFITKEHS